MKKLFIIFVTLVSIFALGKINVNAEELHEHNHVCENDYNHEHEIESNISLLSAVLTSTIVGHENCEISWNYNENVHSAFCFSHFTLIYQQQSHEMTIGIYENGHHYLVCICGYDNGNRHETKYFTTENQHLKMCTVCNIIVENVESHTSFYIISDNYHKEVCSVCQYTIVSQSAHINKYVSGSATSSNHTVKCIICNHTTTESHKFTSTPVAGSCQIKLTCTTCNYSVINSVDHNFQYTMYDGLYHTKKCTVCNASYKELHVLDMHPSGYFYCPDCNYVRP